MAEFKTFATGETELQRRQFFSYLFAQESAGLSRDGVLSGLVVSQTTTASASVQVAVGAGVVQDTRTAGVFPLVNDAVKTLDVLGANPMGATPRNDLVVFDSATNPASIRVIVGTPNAVPTDPALPATALPLARLRHAASATTVLAAKIDDLRTLTSLFAPPVADTGFVSSGVISAVEGWSVTFQSCRRRDGIVDLQFVVQRTGADVPSSASGNISNVGMGRVAAGWRPSSNVACSVAHTGQMVAAYIQADGTLGLGAMLPNIAWATSTAISFSVTYFAAA